MLDRYVDEGKYKVLINVGLYDPWRFTNKLRFDLLSKRSYFKEPILLHDNVK